MKKSLLKVYIRSFPQMLLAGVVSGIFIYSIFIPAFANFLLGFYIGILSHFFIFSFEQFVKPRLAKRNFFLALATSTLAYISLIVLAVFVSLIFVSRFRVMGVLENFKDILLSDAMMYGIIFGLVLSFLFNSYSMFETLLGKNFLLKLFTGKYHTPFEEDRVFMFLDLKSSTALAEKLGHKVFLNLLNDFFYDVSQAVSETKGEIYKYVGDEAIITWKMKKVKGNALPVDCFFKIMKKVKTNKGIYLKKYGLVPDFKAGMHGGKVVTGEMGYVKKEIAFLGDVLNTTSRIESLCNELNQKLIISDTLLLQLKLPEKYRTKSLGEHAIRGKQKSESISAILFSDEND